MLRIRWPVFVALAIALLAPAPALADEVNPVEGFTGGITDLFTGESREPVADPVRDYEYEPLIVPTDDGGMLRAGEGQETEPVSMLTSINRVVRQIQAANLDGGDSGHTLYYWARVLVLNVVVPIAVGFVFFWWGLRKAKIMIVNAWRKGRATA